MALVVLKFQTEECYVAFIFIFNHQFYMKTLILF